MRQTQRVFSLFLLSPSSRRAWIEMTTTPAVSRLLRVALLAEGVDRNQTNIKHFTNDALVALLAEGVDRNRS